jgi:hypothetical protein
MHERTAAGLLPNLLTQAHGRPLASATGAIAFGEGFVAVDAPEASFVQHQFDLMSPQGHIAFAPWAHIMLFDAHRPTMRTRSTLIRSYHFDSDLSVGLHLLLEDAQIF